MGRYLFVVLTSPVEGQETEFNDWYDNVHISDVLKLDDYVSAQRFRFAPTELKPTPLRPYLALYETETDNVAETQRRLAEVVDTSAMPFSPAIDQSATMSWYYEPITEKRTK